ncbi:MAG: DUF134 domain-containing protein [Lachnospiraceae bacterium]|nr:DUF134 domain-containing protein [Lachnospiraceae bacterium]
MPRPVKCRRVCMEPEYTGFLPDGITSGEDIVLTVDEYEVIRLVDLEKKTHVQTAEQMGISKTTVTEIYESAREKIADCLVNGKRLLITGGNYKVCDGTSVCNQRQSCLPGKSDSKLDVEGRTMSGGHRLVRTGVERRENEMRIAVTYENGEIFQHFGHTEQFKVYDVEDNRIVKEQVVDTNGQGHGALANLLLNGQVNVLICGGIGSGAQNALAEAGIKLYGGVSGNADEAVAAYIAGRLDYNPDVKCSHHEHGEGHSCGEHSCGEDKHGCAGNE